MRYFFFLWLISRFTIIEDNDDEVNISNWLKDETSNLFTIESNKYFR